MALFRRFNGIIPFLPFTEHEQVLSLHNESATVIHQEASPSSRLKNDLNDLIIASPVAGGDF